MTAVGRRGSAQTSWPPVIGVCELAARVKRVHAGETVFPADGGELVDVLAYRDTLHQDRKVFRVRRGEAVVSEYKEPEDMAKVLDLATLVERAQPS